METIKFTNEYGDEVDENQKDVLEYFFKIYLVDGKPVKEEIYRFGSFIGNSYFVSSLEEIEVRLKEHPSASFDYIYNKNGYLIRETRGYNNNLLTSCTTSVENKSNESIRFAKQQMHEGKLKLVMIEKSFYKDGELLYKFDYNKDGSCFLVSNEQKYQSDIYGWDIKDIFWEGLEYYKTAEPIIPEK